MRQVLIDANLLLLLVVGLKDPALIARHKRTSAFIEEDFHLLERVLDGYEQVTVTPNILTECSNLLGHESEPLGEQLMTILGSLVSSVDERYVASADATQVPEFRRLGLSDAAAIDIVGPDSHLLTADLALYLAAATKSPGNAFNFTHMRNLGGV